MRKILMLAAISGLMMAPAFADASKPESKPTVESLQMQIKERDATIAGLNAWIGVLQRQRNDALDQVGQVVGQGAIVAAKDKK